MTESCGDCRYARPSVDVNALGRLECHRFSPVPPAPHDLAAAVQLGRVGVWPVVDEGAWCGEWRPIASEVGR